MDAENVFIVVLVEDALSLLALLDGLSHLLVDEFVENDGGQSAQQGERNVDIDSLECVTLVMIDLLEHSAKSNGRVEG